MLERQRPGLRCFSKTGALELAGYFIGNWLRNRVRNPEARTAAECGDTVKLSRERRIEHDAAVGTRAIETAREAVQQDLRGGGAWQREHRTIAGGASHNGCTVEVACTVKGKAGDRQGAVGSTKETIKRNRQRREFEDRATARTSAAART